jgi:hypothetical protein
MKDPERLIIERAGELEGQLLRLVRDDVPKETARHRTRAALVSASGKGRAFNGAASPESSGGGIASTLRSSAASRWVVVALATGAITVAVHRVLPTAKPVSPDETAAPMAPERPNTAPAASSLPSADVDEPAPKTLDPEATPAPRMRAARGAPSREPTSSNQLAEEIAAIDGVRQAVQAHDAPRALELLRGYQKKFPRGYLGREASLLGIEALIANGQRDAAMAAARSFLARDPTGPSAEKVRRMLSLPTP